MKAKTLYISFLSILFNSCDALVVSGDVIGIPLGTFEFLKWGIGIAFVIILVSFSSKL